MNCPCLRGKSLPSLKYLPRPALPQPEIRVLQTAMNPRARLHGINAACAAFTQARRHIFCAKTRSKAETAKFNRIPSAIYKDLGFRNFASKFSTGLKTRRLG